MAPSNKKAQQVDHAGEQEQVLQAVVVADSAEVRFRPMTVGRPRVAMSGGTLSHAGTRSHATRTHRPVPAPAGQCPTY